MFLTVTLSSLSVLKAEPLIFIKEFVTLKGNRESMCQQQDLELPRVPLTPSSKTPNRDQPSLQPSASAKPGHKAAQAGSTGQSQAGPEAVLPRLYLSERRRSVPSRFSLMSSGERERGERGGGLMCAGSRESSRSLSRRCETGSCSISSCSVWLVLRISSSTCSQSKGQQVAARRQQNAPGTALAARQSQLAGEVLQAGQVLFCLLTYKRPTQKRCGQAAEGPGEPQR